MLRLASTCPSVPVLRASVSKQDDLHCKTLPRREDPAQRREGRGGVHDERTSHRYRTVYRGRPFIWPLSALLLSLWCSTANAEPPGVTWFNNIAQSVEQNLQSATIEDLARARRPINSPAETARALIVVDHIKIRKQHLAEVVALCDRLLSRLSTLASTSDTEALVTELLYRKGRALGYMELPDVIDKFPIADRQRHARLFEENFASLAGRVDMLSPKYILLNIRRERRRGNLPEALRLVEIYGKTHPSPRWYPKKKQDILYEMGLVDEPFPKDKVAELLKD